MNKTIPASLIPALLGGLSVPVVQAQEAGAKLEEVVVTSRRVEERLQDIPLAVTAMSAEALERKNFDQLLDLAQTVPGVQQSTSIGRRNALSFVIRGQLQDDLLQAVDPAVPVYIGGVIQPVLGTAVPGALDVRAVEVLKGPQGTLFGRNTTGGAVNITPNEPGDTFAARIKAGGGNFGRWNVEGMINVPVNDALAVRFAATHVEQDGTWENLSAVGEDFYSRNDTAARLTVKWAPTDRITSSFMFDGFFQNATGPAPVLSAVNPAVGAGALKVGAFRKYSAERADDFFTAHADIPTFTKLSAMGGSNTTTFEVSDNITLKNIIAIRSTKSTDQNDLDAVDRLVDFPAFARIPFSTTNLSSTTQLTEEFQVLGKYDRIDWIAGLYYYRLHGLDIARSVQGDLLLRHRQSGGKVDNESFAGFAQGTYHLTDNLNLTAGLRFTKDNRGYFQYAHGLEAPFNGANYVLQLNNPCLVIGPTAPVVPYVNGAGVTVTNRQLPNPGNACGVNLDTSFEEPTWTVSLDWKFAPGQLAYIAHRHGYRSGAWNGRGAAPIEYATPTSPEIVNDVEIGYKGDIQLMNRPLRLNADWYHMDYSDIQKTSIVANVLTPGVSNTILENAAAATITGFELEVTWLPLDELELSVTYAWTDATYDEWPATRSALNVGTGQFETISFSRVDQLFRSVPEHAGSVSARYRLPLSDDIGGVYVGGNAYWQSRTAIANDNIVDGAGQFCPGTQQGGYTIYGARVDWEGPMGNDALQVSWWGKNLGNKGYYQGSICFFQTLGSTTNYGGDPMTWGFDVSYRFGD
ncbi:MAG: TonB-dependent receptor [Gammaproteobacteria bacterium]